MVQQYTYGLKGGLVSGSSEAAGFLHLLETTHLVKPVGKEWWLRARRVAHEMNMFETQSCSCTHQGFPGVSA